MIELGRHSYAGAIRELYNPLVKVGSFCSIANGVTFMGSGEHPPVGHHCRCVSSFPFREKGWGDYWPCTSRGPIVVGNDVWIGEDALILDGVEIGDGAIVGARAVVAKAVPPYAVVAGNPARIVKYRFSPAEIEALLRIKWWQWPDEQIREALPAMKEVSLFLERYGI